MSTISNYYKYAEFAFASYSNMIKGMIRPDYIDVLKRGGDGMSQKQADIFEHYLMSNHYHLLLETPEGNLSQIMRHINGAYTTYYNVKRK